MLLQALKIKVNAISSRGRKNFLFLNIYFIYLITLFLITFRSKNWASFSIASGFSVLFHLIKTKRGTLEIKILAPSFIAKKYVNREKAFFVWIYPLTSQAIWTISKIDRTLILLKIILVVMIFNSWLFLSNKNSLLPENKKLIIENISKKNG